MLNLLKPDYNNVGKLLAVVLGLGFIIAFYGEILIHPNDHVFADSGDALKNYYTYDYYINHNQNWVEFEGMNHPYQEHVLYTDCHPVLALVLRALNSINPWFGSHAIGILNLLMLLAYLVTILVIYNLFRLLEVNGLFAAWAAFGIMVLAPQLFRMEGHLSLSYSFAIPLAMLSILKFELKGLSKGVWIRALIVGILWFFIHAYLGMIVAAIFILYGMVKLVFTKSVISNIWIVLIGVVPMFLFRLVLVLTDQHFGRTDNPPGYLEAHSDLASIVLPNSGTWANAIHQFFGYPKMAWEGWSYLGIVTIVVGILVVLGWAFRRSSLPSFSNKNNLYLRIMLVVGVLLFMLSTAIPFRWGLASLLDHFSVLKQFRAIGRFAWPIYFISAIAACYWVYVYAQTIRKQFGLLFMILIPLIYVVEGIPGHSGVSARINKTANVFALDQVNEDLRKAITSIEGKNFEAIVPLPYYYVGSDTYGKQPIGDVNLYAQLLSFHTALPLSSAFLTRTGIWESKNCMQLTGVPYYEKPIFSDFISNRPLLLVVDKSTCESHWMMDLASTIYESDSLKIMSLSQADAMKHDGQKRYDEFTANKDHWMHQTSGLYTTENDGLLKFNDFQSNGGVLWSDAGEYHLIDIFDSDFFSPGEIYEIRIRVNNQGPNDGQDKINGLFFIEENRQGKTVWSDYVNPAHSVDIDGDWSHVMLEYAIEEPADSFKLLFKQSNPTSQDLAFDDLIITKSGTEIYGYVQTSETDSVFTYNGYYIRDLN